VRHAQPTDESRERAALYALGLLEADEARDFEQHLRAGCASCRREVDAFAAAAAELALAAPAVAPGPEVRTRLLARVEPPPAGFHFALAHEGAWLDVGPGVARKDLGGAQTGGSRSYLVRLEPGALVAVHRHARDEHCYVLAGDLHVAGRRLTQGDYHRADAGSEHADLRSPAGCLLLVIESLPGAS
jgi:anti-sigma factor ChrR (cupin superfamily)